MNPSGGASAPPDPLPEVFSLQPARTLERPPLGPYGRTLTLEPAARPTREVEPAELATARTLVPRVAGHGARLGVEDIRVAASAWTKYHAYAVLTPLLAGLSLHGVALDAAPRNARIHLEDDVPTAIRLLDPAPRPADAAAEAATLRAAFAGHLAPTFSALHEATGVAPSVLWGTAGNLCAYLYDRFEETRPGDARVRRHRRLLLDAPEAAWAPDTPNPLRDPVRYEDVDVNGVARRVQVRRTCCMRDRIPGKSACYTCPRLTANERAAALVREGKAK